MTQISSFFDANMVNGVPDREYDATSWANYFKGIIGNGVSITPSSNLQVVAGTGLNVILSPGIAYINGYYYNNTEPLTVPINIANATYPRITSIVIELSLNNREIICKTVDGSAQSSPTAPQITQTESTYQLQLATVYVPAGATAIGTITDTRENSEVCGYMQILAPTLPPTLIKNCDFKNVSLHDLLNNYGTINGGTISNATLNNVNITGDVNCYTTINGGALLYTLLKECTLNNPTLNGGKWTNSTLNEPTVSGSLTLVGGTGIQGGAICNTIFSEEITNEATITGGTYNNPTLQGTITNKGTFNNNNSHIVGGSVQNIQIFNADLLGKVLNLTTIQGGTYNDPTLSGNVEVNNSGAQEALIDYYSGTHTQLVAPNVTGKCTISWWLIKAPLLSGQSINGSIGVLTMSITLDSTYNWSNNNRQEIDISQLPTSSARTITPTPYFQVGTSQGVLWLAGSNLTLEAGKTYTTKALMWQ